LKQATGSRLPLIAAAATGVQVGAAIVASRFVVADVPPLTLAMLRYAIGFAFLLPFLAGPWLSGRERFAARDLLPIAALGIGQFGVLIALLNFGLQHVGAAQAALIFSLFPLLTLMLSAALGRERIGPRLLGGVSLSVAGVALSLAPKFGTGAVLGADWLGELAVLASACVGATCSVLYRPWLQRYPALQVSGFAMAASVLFLAVLALQENWPQRVSHLSLQTWLVVAFIGLSSGLGYVWWLFALKHESPTRVTAFLALNPVTAALAGALFLGESLSAWSMAAMTCIAAGLWLATSEDRLKPR
jgi:drug/metabolite transporter (DMT)-like permease